MGNTFKTTAGRKTTKTSATNLDLTVTTQDEFNNLIAGYRDGFHKTASGFKSELTSLGERKRDALWKDLGAALSIIEIISQPANAEWLLDALDETGVPAVEDDEKQNVYVMYLRLLMGYWPDKPKGWKVGDPEPNFTWSENVWLYASVLRGAVKLGIKGAKLYDQLVADKGLNKCKKADRTRLSNDQEEKDKKARLKAVTADSQIKANVPVTGFRGVPSNGDYVSLFGRVSSGSLTSCLPFLAFMSNIGDHALGKISLEQWKAGKTWFGPITLMPTGRR